MNGTFLGRFRLFFKRIQMKKETLLAITILLLGGNCPAEVKEKSSDWYTIIGAQAISQDRWDIAREVFALAVSKGEEEKMPVKDLAVRTYEYGRALGVTCLFNLAELELKMAYKLDQQAGQPLYFSLTELGRLTLDQKKYGLAVEYFEIALKRLEEADFKKRSPIDYSNILDEYAQALAGMNRQEDAEAFKAKSSKIREENPGKNAVTDRTPYGKFCTKQ